MPGVSNETGQHGNNDQSRPKWKATLVVNPGDLVYLDTSDGYDKSAASYTWDTNLATTQASFHDVFRGVSAARRFAVQTVDGDHQDGNILESGEFRFPCAALGTAVKVGEMVTIAQGTGNTLDPQKVIITTDITLSLGVITRPAAVGDTFLFFKISPAKSVTRGLQAVA